MVTYDSRPTQFTQLTLTSEWEGLMSAMGCQDGIDSTAGGGSAMVPSLDSAGRNAVIADGRCAIKGQFWRCDAPVSTPIPAASAQNRLDRLVVRLNRGATTSPTYIQPVVITGTPSGSPVLPPIVQTNTGLYDIPVSNWLSTSAGGLSTLVDERQLSPDAWHDLRPAASGWTGSISGEYPPQYRKSADGDWVELYGIVQMGTPYTATNVFANPLPPSYRPNHTVRMPIVIYGNGSSSLTSTPFALVLTTGFIQLSQFPTGLAGLYVFFNNRFPLDSAGLIQS